MNKKLFFLKTLIIVFMIAAGVYFYPKLPDMMPTHWNYMWVADRFSPKTTALYMFPLIAFACLLLFQFLPKLDPKKDNYPKFEKAWEAFQFALLIFFAYAHILAILATLYPVNMLRYMMFWLGVLFIVLGNYMGKIRRNYFVWIRLPWTIDNEDVWNKTHRFWWKMFMIWGLLFIANGMLNFNQIWVIGLFVGLVLVLPVIYSYLEFRKITIK